MYVYDHFLCIRDNTFSEHLRIDLRESPLLIAEKSYNPLKNRNKLSELLFEKCKCPALFLSKDSVLSCYSYGKTTGVVLDVGASGAVVSPGWFLL